MSLPPSVDLRPLFAQRGLVPRTQGNRGTCSVFALISVLEFEHAVQGGRDRLSIEFLNWASHQTNGRRVDGSFFSDALEGLRRYGVCRETLLPYASDFDPELKPPQEALEDGKRRRTFSARWFKEWNASTGLTPVQLTAIRACLSEEHPVTVGLRWPKQARYLPGHYLFQPEPSEVFDGHSIVLVGYTDDPKESSGGTFLFRNSAGPEWGQGGYARFSYGYASAYANDAVALSVG